MHVNIHTFSSVLYAHTLIFSSAYMNVYVQYILIAIHVCTHNVHFLPAHTQVVCMLLGKWLFQFIPTPLQDWSVTEGQSPWPYEGQNSGLITPYQTRMCSLTKLEPSFSPNSTGYIVLHTYVCTCVFIYGRSFNKV